MQTLPFNKWVTALRKDAEAVGKIKEFYCLPESALELFYRDGYGPSVASITGMEIVPEPVTTSLLRT
jgi:hypothetical protein